MHDSELISEVERVLESDLSLDAQRSRILQLASGDGETLELILELLVVKVQVQRRLLRKRPPS